MSKESFTEVDRVVGPVITKKDTNCWQYIGLEERLLITLCKPKYLLMTVYLKLQIFVYLQKVLTFRILQIFQHLIIINARIFFYLLHKFYVLQRTVFCHCNASVLTNSLLLCDYATEVTKKPARPTVRNCDREGRQHWSFSRVSGKGLMKSHWTVASKKNRMLHAAIFMQLVAPVGEHH
jgi:hypothetical protein